ncbi:MAG: TetR/AcrR family transcriptional regulator [Clostridiales bacterium]|jgi:AcrR family transcriptional regulator|nr:TetR/AcrR family transcriptional regulator [Clostridiales bacterium]
MYKEQINPTAKRTQGMIADALARLLKEKHYAQITVTDICRKADIVRKTFYRNFSVKEDVINYILDNRFSHFSLVLDNEPKIDALRIFCDLYNMLLEYKEFLVLFHNNGLFHIAARRIAELMRDESIFTKTDRTKLNPKYYKYLTAQIVATMVSIVETWIDDNFSDTPEEIARLTDDIMYGRFYIE